MRRRLLAGVSAAAVAAVASVDARAWGGASGSGDTERVSVRAELGAEYDSNAHRADQLAGTASAVIASPLLRGVFGWSASDRLGDRQDITFSLLGAGKLFLAPEARSENVGIVETSGAWRAGLGSRTRLGLFASYYEAVQSATPTERALLADARDFRSLTPTLRLWRAIGDAGLLSLGAGVRWFVYKPIRSYDFSAPLVSLQYQWSRETADQAAEWELSVGTALELRRFAGARLVPDPPGCPRSDCLPVADPAGVRHEDQFLSSHVEVARTGRFLAGLGYGLQWNRSNSYSETVVRHIGVVRLTVPLPGRLYLAARGELVYARHSDPVALTLGPSGRPSATFEDENRSQVRGELSRDLGGRLQIIARGTYYTSALGGGTAGQSYHRLTATLSIAFNE